MIRIRLKIVRRYPVGAIFPVYYNPDDPAEAVLEPGANGLLFTSVVGGGLATLFGILALRSSLQ